MSDYQSATSPAENGEPRLSPNRTHRRIAPTRKVPTSRAPRALGAETPRPPTAGASTAEVESDGIVEPSDRWPARGGRGDADQPGAEVDEPTGG